MKVSMFHLMPHRELPADFTERLQVGVGDSAVARAGRPGPGRAVLQLDARRAHPRAEMGFDGICVNEHHQNAYGFMPNPNVMGSVLARATNHLDVAIVQMGSTLPTTQPADPGRRGVRACSTASAAGGWSPACRLGTPMDANMVHGHPADRAARPLLRGPRADPAGLAVPGDVRLQRQVQPAALRQHLAPADPAAPPAGVDPGAGQPVHLALRRPARPQLLHALVLRQPDRQADHGRLLGVRRRRGPRPQPLPGRVRPDGLRGRHRRAGREAVRRARPVLLRQVPPRAAHWWARPATRTTRAWPTASAPARR